MIRLLAASAGSLLVLGGSALATGDSSTAPYALAWNIASHAVPAEPFWVKEQAAIAETRLVPVALYVPDADVTTAAGELLVPASAQLVKVGAPHFMACNVNKAATGQAKSRRVCLIDTNDDGRVDATFSKGGGGDYWMTLEGDLAKEKLAPLKSATLREIPAQTMIDAPYLSFHYQRILDGGLQIPLTQEGGDVVRFHFKVGREARREWMVRECRDPALPSQCTSASFPSKLAIAGLELELLERRKEDVLIRMTAAFGGRSVKFTEIHDGYNSGSLTYAD